MKRLMAMTLCGVMGCVAMAQAIPEKIYVSRYSSEKRVEVVGGMYVDSMKMTLGNVKLYDSLYFHMTDGTTRGFRVRGIDSITMDEPRDLLLKELDYYNKISNKRIPTYSDSYVNIASWTQRSQWNLANVHDPTVMKAADGYYYMYQTDASYGNSHVGHGHFHGRRSRDLVNWEYLGGTLMDDQPQWALDSVNAYFSRMGRAKVNKLTDMGYWAPVVRKINDNLYRMYYCLVPSGWAFIGMMETTDPASNKWEDKGFVISSSSDKSASAYGTGSQWGGWFCFNAIDPTYEVTPDGKHWLIYGSWHTGIAAVEINPETGKLMESPGNPWNIGSTSPGATTRYGKRVYTRKAGDRWQASEGPEVIYNPETGYYYMFLAYDELAVAYNTRVCRARNITGPYYGMDGTNVTNGGDCYP
jgi:beta-xylosidase